MDLALEKKVHVFRLPTYLLDRLKELAAKIVGVLTTMSKVYFWMQSTMNPMRLQKLLLKRRKPVNLKARLTLQVLRPCLNQWDYEGAEVYQPIQEGLETIPQSTEKIEGID